MSHQKKFVASYSGGKDSILAIYRAIKNGYKPVCLLTTYDEKNERSWFHNIPQTLLEEASKALDIPLVIIKTEGTQYAHDFERALSVLKSQGVDTCVFGDIDIQEHLDWCSERCKNVGLDSYFPLWQENRKKLVYEFIDSGFQAIITVIDTTRMNEQYLGQTLMKELVEQLEQENIDVCGENGEYHTFVYDGPIFKENIHFQCGDVVRIQNHVRIPVKMI